VALAEFAASAQEFRPDKRLPEAGTCRYLALLAAKSDLVDIEV